MTSTQATAASRSRMIEVMIVARSRTTIHSRDADSCRSAGTMGVVYVGRQGAAMAGASDWSAAGRRKTGFESRTMSDDSPWIGNEPKGVASFDGPHFLHR